MALARPERQLVKKAAFIAGYLELDRWSRSSEGGRENAPQLPDACRRRRRRDFSFACPTMRITGGRGGLLSAYAERFEAARASGEQVIIDGTCLSACTLAIAILPRGQVCATSNAVLGFHAAWRPTANGGRVQSPVATKAMYDVYPANVRSWIARRGGLSASRVMLLKGRQLTAMVPACEGGARLSGQPAKRTVRRVMPPHATLAAQRKR